jgi:long-chain acyl-CoA synthetase
VNTKEFNRPDSIGLPLRGVEVRIAEDKELLVKGDNIMQGYWQNECATADSILESEDGRWLKTGDCASIDEQGFIRIIGRIKDILVLANGEKVPPSDIESAISCKPLFAQAMVVGEGKSFLSALVVLNPELFETLCSEQNWDRENLPKKELNSLLLKEIAVQMKGFPGYAKIRRVHVCPKEWTVEDGLITPTMKIKRPQIMQQFSDQIERFYVRRGGRKL